MTLVSGREIAHNGIPHDEVLTVYASGREWIDQQWLAQIGWYYLERATGLGGVAIVDVLVVAITVGSAMAGARLLGASARSTFLVSAVCLFMAPWSWQIRAQALALPLFVWTVWLAADHVRHRSRRLLLALPLLIVWANVHGSVILGATITAASFVVAALSSRPRTIRSLAAATGLALAAVACVFATPYGLDIASYYHLLLVDPPFGDAIVEWKRTTPNPLTAIFFVTAAASLVVVVIGRARMTWFEIAVLLGLFVGAIDAVRGIVWFSLAVATLLPNALDAVFRGADEVKFPRMNVGVAVGALVATVVTVAAVATRPGSWFVRDWPEGVVTAVRSAGPAARVYPSDRHADWLLWRLPELRGRVAYDVRFELLTRERFLDLVRFDGEHGPTWRRAARGFDVVVVDELSVPSHTSKLLTEPGARVIFRKEDKVTVVQRRRQ